MYLNSKTAKSVRLALALGAASATAFTANVSAQEEAAENENVEKIAVTGSRIRKNDFVSNAPVATIGAEQFQLSATVNTESLLNTLPQVLPGLDRTSNNPGNGTATVDLRGLGTNRTLVLIDGVRAVPTTSSGTVDINSIPTALIEDVEVLTGGASAVYGSDAVAGVVNFILKDDFEGVEVSAGYESTEEGDAEIYSADLTIGGNFADGRGNVVFNMSFTERGELFQGDRDFSFFALNDNGDTLTPGGSPGIPQGHLFSFAGNWADSATPGGAFFNPDGSYRNYVASGDGNDQFNYAPVNYIQLPQERHQITALGKYEITENAEIYARAMFTDSFVPQQLAPTPFYSTIQFNLDGNPWLTPEAQASLTPILGDGVDTDGDGIDDTGTGFIGRRMDEVGPRRSVDTFQSFSLLTGIRGAIGDSNWTYDVYYQTGKVQNSTSQEGNLNGDRARQAVLLAADPDTGEVIVGDDGSVTCADPSTNGGITGTNACAPMNVFGQGNISADAAAFVSTLVSSVAIFDQKLMGASVAGDSEGWFELPGGPIGMAFGYEHRQESFEFLPSQDLAAGTISGFNGAPPVQGGYTTAEFFAEVYLPILEGVEMAELLDLELAYRQADYSTAGDMESYKIAGSWQPIEEIRFRAGFNTAVRAPNIGELFAPSGVGYPAAEDPCSETGQAQDWVQANLAGVNSLCAATGVPQAAIGTSSLNARSGQIEQFTGGNPNLKEEEAETTTLGFVLTPMDDLSVSFDYFDIEITDFITTFGGGTANVLRNCYDPTLNTEGASSPFCQVINRRASGPIANTQIAFQNVATQTLKGYDLIVNYSMDAWGGTASVDYLGTYSTENEFTAFSGDAPLECSGQFGSLCGEPLPEYKHRTTFKFNTDDYTVQLLWRYVGKVEDDPGFTVSEIGGKSYFDLQGSYYINDNYRVTAGIDNLLDKEPPILGGNQEQANTWPATYDVFGRTYFVNFKATF
ncbi:MAG: TonB-dependent receptor domain-containing protein [Aestuariibacter sp.]